MNLDKLEAIAKAARDQPDGPGNEEAFDGTFHVDVALDLIARVRDAESGMDGWHGNWEQQVAEVKRLRTAWADDRAVLLDAIRYLWDKWADAEGGSQPDGAVFGIPETFGDPDFERRGASAEIQKAIKEAIDS